MSKLTVFCKVLRHSDKIQKEVSPSAGSSHRVFSFPISLSSHCASRSMQMDIRAGECSHLESGSSEPATSHYEGRISYSPVSSVQRIHIKEEHLRKRICGSKRHSSDRPVACELIPFRLRGSRGK